LKITKSAMARMPTTSHPIAIHMARSDGYGGSEARHVAPSSTWCYHGEMSVHPEITQRDLRTKSREIMDAVEHGQSFTVTRDGHRIGELIPLRLRRRFVSRQEFIAMSRNAPAVGLEAFRADQDAAVDNEAGSPYER
jgi:prevent-host-death family protein